ncbi:PLP-dependent aminotransferase family protein [Fodinicurvata halophila]|uniref:PLP-dependent aminotransferase family protein n=1 Tax=Fodinicurvata halophila TaxID=1419723 RepID=A0ABV8UFG6_9PROT
MWTPRLEGRNSVKYLAIVEALSDAVTQGELRPGDRLPPQRDLAWRLDVNLSTVTQAYREAARRHLVGGEVGRGTYVLPESREATLFKLKEPDSRHGLDLSTNVPARQPGNRDLEGALQELIARGDLETAQGYHEPRLLERAGVAGSQWLAQRGLQVSPAAVVPCAGAQQALAAALQSICRPGDSVLVEELTFPGMKAVARQLHLRLVPVAMDSQGCTPEALARAAEASDARVVVLVPLLQNPTGALAGAERCRSLAEVIRQRGLTLVEDDVYGALTDRPPLSGYLPEQSLLVTSLSKAAVPGVRFGMIAGAASLIAPLREETHATTWLLSPLALELACLWIADGTVQRRLEWQKGEMTARWKLARRVLPMGAELPAAPHVWLPVAGDAEAMAERCRRRQVEVVASRTFAVRREVPQGLRLSLTTPATRAELQEALSRVAEVFAETS